MTHEELFALLDQAVVQQRLRELDVALARFLGERDRAAAPALLWLAALLSRQLADGHLCLDLQLLPVLAVEQDWPESWRRLSQALREASAMPTDSILVADGRSGQPAAAPLVLDGTRLYLRRYWNHECVVAAAIRARLDLPLPVSPALGGELARLFPGNGDGTLNWPRIACALAARSAFTVITGGPGTGKTTTVVRLLGLLQTLHLREHEKPLRIRLAAPTGKAAARLNASIAAQLALLDVDENVRRAIPADVVTLHRLLGARPDTRRFRHDQASPMHLDVLVIDEASMVDLEMMAAVLSALPTRARLILLGDKDQLASVEAGAVLGDLCQRAEAGHYTFETARWLRSVGGDDIGAFVRDDARPLDQQVAMLRHSHRFDAASGIGRLAAAVNEGDAASVTALLDGASDDLVWTSGSAPLEAMALDGDVPSAAGDHRQGYRHYLELLRHRRPEADASETAYAHWAQQVLQAFGRFQLLCAVRQGPSGTQQLNQRIAAALLDAGLIDADHGWYEGRPLMVTRNDYGLGLMNGDVGIVLRRPDRDGAMRLYAAFPADVAPHGGPDAIPVRFVPPSRLGEVQTVYAMTVHKSQGSEFEHTALVLPDEPPGALTRELLYTGITRARRWFSLVASRASVDLAVAQRTRRHSGLAGRLLDS